jgi:hypothetical protein
MSKDKRVKMPCGVYPRLSRQLLVFLNLVYLNPVYLFTRTLPTCLLTNEETAPHTPLGNALCLRVVFYQKEYGIDTYVALVHGALQHVLQREGGV